MSIVSDFPKNLAYNLKQLSGFSKTTVKITPDRTSIGTNDIIRFKLPSGTLVDLRSLVWYFTADCSGTCSVAGGAVHLPRYSSSLIERLTVSANGITLSSISSYGLLYNSLMDMEGADISQASKRITERYDPTTTFTSATASNDNKISVVEGGDNGGTNDAGVKLAVNNWMGLLNNISTPVIDTSFLGDVIIEIQTAPASVLWAGVSAVSPVYSNTAFTLSNNFMTISKIVFNDDLYYQLLSEKLLSSSLLLGYYDYYTARGSATQKSSGISINFNINSASLDQLITTFQHSDFNSTKPLVAYGYNGITDADGTGPFSMAQILADPAARTNTIATAATINTDCIGFIDNGDAFCQSWYFKRGGNALTNAQYFVNNVAVNPYALTPIEIFNENLQAMGYNNIDVGTNGIHAGCLSLEHFLKYYYVHILSLENISGDGNHWISGLDGNSASINIQYNASFSSTNTQQVIPVVFCRSSKILNVSAGRQLSVI